MKKKKITKKKATKKKITKKKATKKKITKKKTSTKKKKIRILGNSLKYVGFRCPKLLASMLESRDNMSQFIKEAIYEKMQREGFTVTCPTCKGEGNIEAIKKLKKRG